MNTNMKSWWFTSSIGCSEHIENRLEQFKYKKSFEKIKNTFIQSSSETNGFRTHQIRAIFGTSSPIMTYENNDARPKTNKIENFIISSCILPFYTIEIIHSAVLIFLSVSS